MLTVLCVACGDIDATSAVLWASVPVYVLHQLEEWGVDARGRHYPFYSFFLAKFGCGNTPGSACPSRLVLGPAVNIGCVWLPGLLGAARGPGPALPALGTIAVNALVHILGGIWEGGYNPGLATAALLFVPYTVVAVWTLSAAAGNGTVKAGRTLCSVVAATLAVGVLAHALLGATLKSLQRGLLGQGAAASVFICWGAGAPIMFEALLSHRLFAAGLGQDGRLGRHKEQ